jgi:hypothetical protein
VSKSYSHGCVRLTNWDALELAGMVSKGAQVAFLDGGETPPPVASASDQPKDQPAGKPASGRRR